MTNESIMRTKASHEISGLHMFCHDEHNTATCLAPKTKASSESMKS